MEPFPATQGKLAGSDNGNAAPATIPSPPPVARSPSQSSLTKGVPSHRQSFAENLRNPPPSPRAQRHPSFTQAAVQELLNKPPPNRQPDPRFANRDWRDVQLGELVSQDDVHWVDLDTSVEEATMALLKNSPGNLVLVREDPSHKTAISTFDHNDLNAYLLVVVGLAKPDEEHIQLYDSIAKRAQERQPIPLRDIQQILRKEELITLTPDEYLTRAIEVFGSGIHRVLITNPDSEVLGILSQLKVLEFFWNERLHFPMIDRLYGAPLKDLHVGTQQIIAINADAPLAEALTLMSNEGLTSVAVVDNGSNVVGNISTADVRHLTNAASLPLLQSTCMHFISVILTERGVEKGRDSFPVFYVNPYSTLAHTVAKLVATNSHRMWVVDSASPSPSAPATPLLAPVGLTTMQTSAGGAAAATTGSGGGTTVQVSTSSSGSAPPSPLPTGSQSFGSVPAAAMPGAHLSGRLTGVVSLTDILNLFAKSSGLHPSDPGEQRARRRRSSSSSMRPSLDSSRASIDARR